MKFYENGEALTDPRGFFCSGVHCDVKGVKNGKLDLGIIFSKKPCNSAGVFTTNDVRAAPVIYCQNLLSVPNAVFHAVVANSGNANACTAGRIDSGKMASSSQTLILIRGRIV